MNNISIKQFLLCALYAALVYTADAPSILTAGSYGRLWLETTSLFLLTILCLNRYVPQKSNKGIVSVICAIILAMLVLLFLPVIWDGEPAVPSWSELIVGVSICLAGISFKINKKTVYGIIYVIIALTNTLAPSLFLKH